MDNGHADKKTTKSPLSFPQQRKDYNYKTQEAKKP